MIVLDLRGPLIVLYGCAIGLYAFTWPPQLWPTIFIIVATIVFIYLNFIVRLPSVDLSEGVDGDVEDSDE